MHLHLADAKSVHGGPKLVEAPVQDAGDPRRRDKNGLPIPVPGRGAVNVELGYARYRATQLPLRSLEQGLEVWLGKPVVDETGLSGLYSYELDFSILGLGGVFQIHQPQASGDVSVFKAVEQQLGLKLERAKQTLPILAIDSVQRPTPN